MSFDLEGQNVICRKILSRVFINIGQYTVITRKLRLCPTNLWYAEYILNAISSLQKCS
jgi:hypothetical protein